MCPIIEGVWEFHCHFLDISQNRICAKGVAVLDNSVASVAFTTLREFGQDEMVLGLAEVSMES